MDADIIVPLCGPFANDCHGKFDRGEFDLIGYLDPHSLDKAEQAAAVRVLGIEGARMRLAPSQYSRVAA